MRLTLNQIKIGDHVRVKYPEGEDCVFVYFGEVVGVDKYVISIKTFNGYISVPIENSRIFNDEPAKLFKIQGGKKCAS